MHEGVFIFGSKIFDEAKQRDAISSLPLELAWKIFSYLDNASLKNAFKLDKIWSRIITANKNLRKRVEKFDLAVRLGSERLAKFYKRSVKILKKQKCVNYLVTGVTVDRTMQKTQELKSKRPGGDMVVYTKRFKIF